MIAAGGALRGNGGTCKNTISSPCLFHVSAVSARMTENRAVSAIEERLQFWLRGFDSEIKFWDYWFASKGAEWPEDYKVRLDPNREYPDYMLQGIEHPESAKILDVGSGPVTGFGFNHRGRKLDITACDPLASFYGKILQKYEVDAPVKTVTAFAEELSSYFEPNTFDLVTCSNALDHSFEPLRGIEEMLIVTKLNGRMHLTHRINEAVFGHYKGLHQWNFDAADGDFIIWGNEHRVNVNDVFKHCADIVVHYDPAAGYVTAVFTKKAEPFSSSADRYRKRIVELLPATMMAVYSLVNAGLIKPSEFTRE
jgi:ubiquinone/menaquinone biosynthesis C-methylase UbiE